MGERGRSVQHRSSKSHVASAMKTDLVETPARTPALSPGSGRILRRVFHVQSANRQPSNGWFGPFRADVLWFPVPWVSPAAIHVVRLRRTLVPCRASLHGWRLVSRGGCDTLSPSAKRINVNSRGCSGKGCRVFQSTEPVHDFSSRRRCDNKFG